MRTLGFTLTSKYNDSLHDITIMCIPEEDILNPGEYNYVFALIRSDGVIMEIPASFAVYLHIAGEHVLL